MALPLLRLDPAIRDGAAHQHSLRAQELGSAAPPVPLEAQIFSTTLDLAFLYIPSHFSAQVIRIIFRKGVSGQFRV
jgi:hypothetical protein